MIGVLLAGGTGSRLRPATFYLNKHLLPVGDKPMIYWPLQTMIKSGLKEIVVVCGSPFGVQVRRAIKELKLNASICFVNQPKPLGMPDAINTAREVVGGESIFVCGGDNVFGSSYEKIITNFNKGEISMLRQVADPTRFGVPLYEGKKLVKIVEKPQAVDNNWAITGPHIFDNAVFELIKKLQPSARGELEISDLHQQYLERGELVLIKRHDYWQDVGTYESLAQAGADFVANKFTTL
jgi:glucose-1-phosphate thymidylyltransferase